jgi:predicted nucleic acid-binding protein
VSEQEVGLLDTNIFIHAQSNDRFSVECRRFLLALQDGRARAHLDPLVLHELSFVLPRYLKQWTRIDVAIYLKAILSWSGVQGEKNLMVETVDRWVGTPHLAFVDAYLAALAARRSCAVYAKNVRELTGQGVQVPDTLPDGR